MIVGRSPRMPVIGDTVLSRADHARGTGIIVGTDAVRYKVYWRDGRDTLWWHVRPELTGPRLDYGRRGPGCSPWRVVRAPTTCWNPWRRENEVPDRRQGS